MTAVNLNRAIRGPVTAVPIVAGKGVRLVADTQNNRWVVEADETVLWEGTYSGAVSDSNFITLSEDPANFETVLIINGGNYKSCYTFDGSSGVWSFMQTYAASTSTTVYANRYEIDHVGKKVTCKACNTFVVSPNKISNWAAAGMNVGEVQLTKVVGIHRIASN